MYTLPYAGCHRARRVSAPGHFKFTNMRYAIDFALPVGTKIVASRGGIVVARESRYNTNYKHPRAVTKANYIIIRHGDGTETVYAHLAWRSIVPKIGQKVRRRQIIAQSGETGYATYPHLHFALYDNLGRNIRITFDMPLPQKISHKNISFK